MTHPRVLDAAIRIGQLSTEPPSPEVARAALVELSHVIPCDASSIVLLEPTDNIVLAELGYDEWLSDAFSKVFPTTPWMANVIERRLPPSISTEPGDAFRRGRFFDTYVRPTGIRDGLTGLLRRDDRILGTVNLSCTRDLYDEEHRRTLSIIIDALSRISDIHGRVPDENDGTPAAALRDGEVVEIPGRLTPAVVNDIEFRTVVRHFGNAAGTGLSFIWPTAGTWYRTVLEPAVIPELGGRSTVVRARPVPAPHGLSVRELEVLTCLALGMNNDAIARIFTISARTVHGHVEHILRKANVRSRTEWRERLFFPRPQICDLALLIHHID